MSLAIDEIADLLVSSETELLPAGNYVNRRCIIGYFMQAAASTTNYSVELAQCSS